MKYKKKIEIELEFEVFGIDVSKDQEEIESFDIKSDSIRILNVTQPLPSIVHDLKEKLWLEVENDDQLMYQILSDYLINRQADQTDRYIDEQKEGLR